MRRVIYFLLMTLSFVFFPWWVGALFVVGGIMLYPFYWEALIASLALDTLFGVGVPYFFDFTLVCTLVVIILLICATFIKSELRSKSDSYYV